MNTDPKWLQNLGMAAFQVYAQRLGVPPSWEALSPNQQQAWSAAAKAIRDDAINDAGWSSLGPL